MTTGRSRPWTDERLAFAQRAKSSAPTLRPVLLVRVVERAPPSPSRSLLCVNWLTCSSPSSAGDLIARRPVLDRPENSLHSVFASTASASPP